MSGVRFQFHAEPTELLTELLPRWLDALTVFILAERGDALTSVESVEALAAVAREGLPDRVLLRLEPFVITGDAAATRRANPGGMGLLVGDRRGDTLSESAFQSNVTDPTALKAWRNVVRRARRDLRSGGTWVGPTGIEQAAPTHRYSPGAGRAAAEGTRLLAIAGEAEFVPGG